MRISLIDRVDRVDAIRVLPAELGADDLRAVDHGAHLAERDVVRQILQAAVGRDDDLLRGMVDERSADAGGDDLRRLDVVGRQVEDTDEHRLVGQLGQHGTVELGLCGLDRDRVDRRTLLIRALAGALAGLGAAAAIPIFSLGPAPGRALFETAWRGGGRRLALAGGAPVRPEDLPVGGVLTVFPDGDDHDPNAATLLIRVEPALIPGRVRRVLEDVHPRGLPGRPVPGDAAHPHLPCHQSTFDVLEGARPVFGPAARPLPRLPIERRGETFVATGDFPEPVGPELLEHAAVMRRFIRPTPEQQAREAERARLRALDDRPTTLERVMRWVDTRTGLAGVLRTALHKVFPDHWSFLLGEIALFCFIILVATGTFLTFFYVPSAAPVIYDGPWVPLQGQEVSAAFDSVMALCFEVRAGLLMRQIHHWTALVFVAIVVVHLCRVFFTGAFRRPREINWLIGFTLLVLAMGEGFTGYSLPDDLLSGTGARIAYSMALSIPFIGPWVGVAGLRRGVPDRSPDQPVLRHPRDAAAGRCSSGSSPPTWRSCSSRSTPSTAAGRRARRTSSGDPSGRGRRSCRPGCSS